jgi:hypothetical protein
MGELRCTSASLRAAVCEGFNALRAFSISQVSGMGGTLSGTNSLPGATEFALQQYRTKMWQFRHAVAEVSVVAWHQLSGFREVGMANFLRSATIVLMGATVMAAGVVVVLYS